MILKGDFEKRVFITFFIVSFVLIFLMTFLEWTLIRYIIHQHENKQITGRISQIQSSINSIVSDNATLVNRVIKEMNLAEQLLLPNLSRISEVIAENTQDTAGHFLVYDDDLRLLYGDRVIPLEDYLPTLMYSQIPVENQFFFSLGAVSYHTTYDIIFDAGSEERKPLGMIIYMEEFDIQKAGRDFDFTLFQITQTDNIDFVTIPAHWKDSTNRVKRSLSKTVSGEKESCISRISIDSALGSVTRYDIFRNPALIILIPFHRDFNAFAHKGLLVFALIVLATALVVISLAGTWFSKYIIAPVKDVSVKMREMQKKPTTLVPLKKKYHGILGSMIDTFNSMNRSLSTYSQSLLEYRTIINNLDSGILWMDKDFKIILCNPSILDIFEVDSVDDVIGKKLSDLLNIGEQNFKETRNKGLSIPHLEISSADKKKVIKFVIFSLKKVDEKAETHYVSSITDITKESKEEKARRKLEMELIKSNRLAELGRLVEGVVHNINSPLNTIVGYAQLIKKQFPECTDIDLVFNAGNRVAKTVKQLMVKARKDSLSMTRQIDINEVVTQELEMCRHNIFFAHSVELVTDLAPIKEKVNAAYGDISLCIANLLNNAIQAMENTENKILTVKTSLEGYMIAVQVSDTGTGIPEENLERIFSPDFSTKDAGDGEGFGLGLPISKSLIEKYKGIITVNSTVGEGTTFNLYFPCHVEA